MKRILIINVNWLGDTLFALPFIRTVRENKPDSYITVFTHPRCVEMLEGNPHINEIIVYDKKGRHKSLMGKFEIVSLLKSKNFDVAFILRKSLSRTMLLFLSKIPERIGYDSKRAGFLLTRRIALPPKDTHRAEYFLGILRAVGIQPKRVSYEFFISEKDRAAAVGILAKEGLGHGEDFIVMNPGGNWDLKRWPPENFAKLGDEIFERFNMKVALTGAGKDMDLCEKISGMMRHESVLLCGRTGLKALGAIFEKAKMVISNDSGPMHIAAAIGTRVVALFGPTSPKITGPYGSGSCNVLRKDIGCEIPCYNLSCKDNKCMKAITVDEVIKAI